MLAPQFAGIRYNASSTSRTADSSRSILLLRRRFTRASNAPGPRLLKTIECAIFMAATPPLTEPYAVSKSAGVPLHLPACFAQDVQPPRLPASSVSDHHSGIFAPQFLNRPPRRTCFVHRKPARSMPLSNIVQAFSLVFTRRRGSIFSFLPRITPR